MWSADKKKNKERNAHKDRQAEDANFVLVADKAQHIDPDKSLYNPHKIDVTFSGAGFMGCYYFGVIDCFNKYIPRDRVNRVSGASAGSLSAAYYLIDLPIEKPLKRIIELLDDVRRRPLGVFDRSNQIVDVLPRALDEIFPDDAHKRVNGRLYVAMTRLSDMKSVVVNQFETRKDLIDALNCSCFIPVWSGNHVSTYKGVKYIDGGIKNNLPVFDEHTIRVSCFAGAMDITPYDPKQSELFSATILNTPLYFTMKNFRRGYRALFPPPADFIVDIIRGGYQDAKDAILSNDLIQCDNCYAKLNGSSVPILNSITPSITPAASPTLSRAASRRSINRSTSTGLLANSNSTLDVSANNQLEPTTANNNNSRSSFKSLLRFKLNRVADATPSAQQSHQLDTNGNNIVTKYKLNSDDDAPICLPEIVAPEIVIDEPDEARNYEAIVRELQQPLDAAVASPDFCRASAKDTRNRDSESRDECGPDVGSANNNQPESYTAKRRNTRPKLDGATLLTDKFAFMPNQLPSCPPSPNLNRRCGECARLRQEARLNLVDDSLLKVVAKFQEAPAPEKEYAKVKSRMSNPIRWMKQLTSKHSYSFVGNNISLAQQEIPTA